MASMTTRQQIPFNLAITKPDGSSAPINGVPVYASSDETQIVVVPAADGLSGVINAVAPPAAGAPAARVTVTANADMNPADPPVVITGVSEDITVTLDPRDQASVVAMTLQPAVDKPPAA